MLLLAVVAVQVGRQRVIDLCHPGRGERHLVRRSDSRNGFDGEPSVEQLQHRVHELVGVGRERVNRSDLRGVLLRGEGLPLSPVPPPAVEQLDEHLADTVAGEDVLGVGVLRVPHHVRKPTSGVCREFRFGHADEQVGRLQISRRMSPRAVLASVSLAATGTAWIVGWSGQAVGDYGR